MRRMSAKRNVSTAWTRVTEAREIRLKGRQGFHVRHDDEEQKCAERVFGTGKEHQERIDKERDNCNETDIPEGMKSRKQHSIIA
jgi:hypothetical protein